MKRGRYSRTNWLMRLTTAAYIFSCCIIDPLLRGFSAENRHYVNPKKKKNGVEFEEDE